VQVVVCSQFTKIAPNVHNLVCVESNRLPLP
jgi:hypothetical protein